MHLLYVNIAPNIVSIWMGGDESVEDRAFLKSSTTFRLVDECLTNAGRNINSSVRRPRSLTQRKRWKAAEWKHFVNCTSSIALHENIPTEALDGWWLFVQLSELLSRHELLEEDVVKIGRLSRSFFRHFSSYYYTFAYSRIHLCRYVYHLLLHFEENIRNCGPLSLLAQWTMENYVGDTNRRCSATNLFGESVAENLKFQSAARLISLREKISVKYLDEDPSASSVTQNPALFAKSDMDRYEGYTFLHPRREISVEDAGSFFEQDIRRKLVGYYQRELDYSEEKASFIVSENPNIVVWSRLHQEGPSVDKQVIYRSAYSLTSADSRVSCYLAGLFASHKHKKYLEMFYGKAIGFIEHKVGKDCHMLGLVSWIVSGLENGEQGQVFARKKLNSRSLFSGLRIESIHCVGHPIGVVEAKKKVSGRESTRVYFIDELREMNKQKRSNLSDSTEHISPEMGTRIFYRLGGTKRY